MTNLIANLRSFKPNMALNKIYSQQILKISAQEFNFKIDMEEEAKKSDLLKNDFEDLDVGAFKIKKKVKI
mgnify:CR=1 FL=1